MDRRVVISVTLILLSGSRCSALYPGDSCFAENSEGKCQLLRLCQPLMSEIRMAGSPLPRHLSQKLNALNCGFQEDQPLVCCVEPLTNINSQTSNSRPNGNTEYEHHNTQNPIWGKPQKDKKPWDTTTKRNRPTWGSSNDDENYQQNSNFGSDDRSSSNISDDGGPPDVRGHRNLRLLPSSNCGVIDEDRIIGGNRTNLFQMPWMVLIAYNSQRGRKLSCAGTLINKWYVMTAAHCVTSLGSKLTLIGVVLGDHDIRTDPDCERLEGDLICAPNARNVSIDKVISHPGYSPSNLVDDIALIRISEPADFSLDHMKPICLPTTRELQTADLVGLKALVTGWGATEDGLLQSPVLLRVTLPVMSNTECQAYFKGHPRIHERQLCAGGVERKDSCGGDSGGPLLYPGQAGDYGVRYVQRGIVSFGSKKCGVAGYPGIYTRVAYYMDWILDNMTE